MLVLEERMADLSQMTWVATKVTAYIRVKREHKE